MRNAPCPNRGRVANALNTRSLLQAITGIWEPVGNDELLGFSPGSPCVNKISVIICNDVSQLIGSPRRMIAGTQTNHRNSSLINVECLPSIGRKSFRWLNPLVCINSHLIILKRKESNI